MEDYTIYNDNDTDLERVDLAYTYLKDKSKSNSTAIHNLRSRAATFLGFAGLLLRFIIELSDSQPSYKLTKLLAFLTCFCSIALLGWALSSKYPTATINPVTYVDGLKNATNIFLENTPVEAKMFFIGNFISSSEFSFTMIDKIKSLLNTSIVCLVFSAFFFTLNGILVTFLGK
jgi:hypothetical protein